MQEELRIFQVTMNCNLFVQNHNDNVQLQLLHDKYLNIQMLDLKVLDFNLS